MTRWKSADLATLQQKRSAKPPVKKAQPSQLIGIAAIEAQRKAAVLIGIDPGTNTGLAVKEHLKFQTIETLTIFEAINRVIAWKKSCDAHLWTILVRIEDARLRTWFGNTGPEKWKGAGSIGRDCAIWVEVLTELKIPYELVHPKNVKETTSDYFKRLTGWKGRTSIHAREAAFLIL